MTRDGEASPSDFARLVVDHLGAETLADAAARAEQAVVAAEEYVAPGRRSAALEEARGRPARLLAEAEPASDAQFQLAPTFARVARTPRSSTRCRGARRPAPGRASPLDPDLRWQLLTGLVVGGRAGEPDIAALLEEDATATGREAALVARAAIQTPEGKEAAWASRSSPRS